MPTVPSGSTAAFEPASQGEEESTPRAPSIEDDSGEARPQGSVDGGSLVPASAPEPGGESADSSARIAKSPARTGSDANLHTLLSLVEQAAQGVTGARAAGEQLARELEALRSVLAEKLVSSEHRALELSHECEYLRQQLADVQLDARRQREFWAEEQDRFLSGILEDHEQLVSELRRDRDEARASADHLSASRSPIIALGNANSGSRGEYPGAAVEMLNTQLEEAMRTIAKLRTECDRGREVVRRLQAQRDDAHEQVAVLVTERDKAYRELLTLHAERMAMRQTIPAEAREQSLPPDAAGSNAPGESRSGRRTDPMPNFTPGSDHPTFPAQPVEAQIALSRPSESDLFAAEFSATPAPADTPSASEEVPSETKPVPDAPDPVIETYYPSARPGALKQKPDPTATPLGSYSLSSEELKQNRDNADSESPKPPRR